MVLALFFDVIKEIIPPMFEQRKIVAPANGSVRLPHIPGASCHADRRKVCQKKNDRRAMEER